MGCSVGSELRALAFIQKGMCLFDGSPWQRVLLSQRSALKTSLPSPEFSTSTLLSCLPRVGGKWWGCPWGLTSGADQLPHRHIPAGHPQLTGHRKGSGPWPGWAQSSASCLWSPRWSPHQSSSGCSSQCCLLALWKLDWRLWPGPSPPAAGMPEEALPPHVPLVHPALPSSPSSGQVVSRILLGHT